MKIDGPGRSTREKPLIGMKKASCRS